MRNIKGDKFWCGDSYKEEEGKIHHDTKRFHDEVNVREHHVGVKFLRRTIMSLKHIDLIST